MEWVKPCPANAAFVVIGEDPLQALEVALSDVFDELLYVLLIHVKLLAVVSHFPALLTQLDLVHVFLSACLRFLV